MEHEIANILLQMEKIAILVVMKMLECLDVKVLVVFH